MTGNDLGPLLGGLGALTGGIAAWRTKGFNTERLGWERILRAMTAENEALRKECRLLRSALRRALRRETQR